MSKKKHKAPTVLGLKISGPEIIKKKEGSSYLSPAIGWALVKDWFLHFPTPKAEKEDDYEITKVKGWNFIVDYTQTPNITSRIIRTKNMQDAEELRDKILKDVGLLLCGATLDGKYFIYSDFTSNNDLNEKNAYDLSKRIRKALNYYVSKI